SLVNTVTVGPAVRSATSTSWLAPAAVAVRSSTVVDGITGDLVPPRDPRALATALRRLLTDDVRRYGYAAAAADRAAASYSWPRIAERLAAVYTTVADLEVAA
ncbi:glycosyltransferase, partial [Actinoplanes philippinensis]|uniref:glycosyltransferase n=1 Tax=Actinoplanes philippinensis TaxID=35752 RepID=UPI003473F64A